MRSSEKFITYIKRNLDELGIVTVLVTIANSGQSLSLAEQDLMVLTALRRSNNTLSNAPLEEVQQYLSSLDEGQIVGLVSNVKGILHEMEFVKIENEDGDSVFASIFQISNHPDTDVMLVDQDSGESWDVQLKATDNTSYVQDWINTHPDGDILITEELAEKMDLSSSGFSNEGLTANVNEFIDKMISFDQLSVISDYFPELTIISVAIVVHELWGRYQQKEISFPRFCELVAVTTGIKVAKIWMLTSLLSVPVVGQLTSVLLITSFLINAKSTWFDKKPNYLTVSNHKQVVRSWKNI